MTERIGDLFRAAVKAVLKGVVIGLGTVVLLALMMWGAYAAGVIGNPIETINEAMSSFGDGLDWKHAVGTLMLAAIGFPILMDILDEMAGLGPYARYRDHREEPRDRHEDRRGWRG